MGRGMGEGLRTCCEVACETGIEGGTWEGEERGIKQQWVEASIMDEEEMKKGQTGKKYDSGAKD